jgi:Transposase
LNIFCGVDKAEGHHEVAVIDADGQLVINRRITNDVDGFAELLGMLESVGDTSNVPIPVAIETPRGVLVSALRATGRPVYAIKTMVVARYRERHPVAGKKSDHVDAMTLANILQTDAALWEAAARFRACTRHPAGADGVLSRSEAYQHEATSQRC